MSNKEYNKSYYQQNKVRLSKASKLYNEAKKESIAENKKQYYEQNKETIKLQKKLARETNKDHIREVRKQYRLKNKEKIAREKKLYQEKLLSTDIGKLSHNIRQAIRRSLTNKGYTKKLTSESILGCSPESFKLHIEGLFESWMNWGNKGLYNGKPNHGWDLDHIIPLSSANTEDEIIKLNHYSNIRPLCSYINRDIKKNLLS